MSFDGLIFDLDGTLLDCSKLSAGAINAAFKAAGLDKQISDTFIKSISGKPSSECDEILLAGVPPELRQNLAGRFDELEIAAIKERAEAAFFPGVQAGLLELKDQYRLFVVSNCSERYLNILHSHSSIGNLILDSECYGRTKRPKHENIQALIKRQKLVSPCYIGDTAGDEAAAAKAGVPFFHAGYGFGRAVGEPHAFESFDVLTDYFMKLPSAVKIIGN